MPPERNPESLVSIGKRSWFQRSPAGRLRGHSYQRLLRLSLSMSKLKYILGTILAILFLACLAVVYGLLSLPIMVIYAVGVWLSESLFFRKMAFRGRVIKSPRLTDHLDEASGTLIVEQLALGWNYSRLWWTEDNVSRVSPAPIPHSSFQVLTATVVEKQDLLTFVEWASDNYLDVNHGRALLVRPRNGRKAAMKLMQRYPAVEYVEIWTGGIEILRAELEDEPGSAPA